jgi:type III secretion protein J
VKRAWLLALALLLSGCKVQLYTRLSEPDANDALYTLLQGGIDAEKRADAESTAGGGPAHFALWVEKDDQARAIGLLKAQAQPEFKHASLGELFSRNPLISTPGEERIRFVYGTEQALAQTLSQIDGGYSGPT